MRYFIVLITALIMQSTHAASIEIESYLANSGAFEALIKKENVTGKLPRIKNKTTADLLEKLSKDQSALTAKKYTLNSFGDLVGVCGKANQLGMTYMLHGMASVIKKSDSPKVTQLKVSTLMAENSIKYQDELTVFYPFLVECLAIQSTLVEPFWASLPPKQRTQVRVGGVNKMRSGTLQLYSGVLMSLGDKALNASFKDPLLESAIKAAPAMASILPIASRQAILTLLSGYGKTASKTYREKFKIISDAFSKKECNIICQL